MSKTVNSKNIKSDKAKTLEEYYGHLDTAVDHLYATEKWLKAIRKELIFYYGDISDVFNTIDFLLTRVRQKP